jgi:hypothetical protein
MHRSSKRHQCKPDESFLGREGANVTIPLNVRGTAISADILEALLTLRFYGKRLLPWPADDA